jgi:hypothetical protein
LSRLHLCLSRGIFPSRFPTKMFMKTFFLRA